MFSKLYIHKIFQTFSINTLATQIAEVMKGWSGLKTHWNGRVSKHCYSTTWLMTAFKEMTAPTSQQHHHHIHKQTNIQVRCALQPTPEVWLSPSRSKAWWSTQVPPPPKARSFLQRKSGWDVACRTSRSCPDTSFYLTRVQRWAPQFSCSMWQLRDSQRNHWYTMKPSREQLYFFLVQKRTTCTRT